MKNVNVSSINNLTSTKEIRWIEGEKIGLSSIWALNDQILAKIEVYGEYILDSWGNICD